MSASKQGDETPNPRVGKREHVLADDRLGRLLFTMSGPAIVGMFVMALYNLIDTMFVGWSVGATAIGALTIAFPIQMFIMSVGFSFGLGGASVVSRALGEGDPEKAHRAYGNVVLTVIGLAVILSAIGMLNLTALLNIFGATEEILPYAQQYVSITLFGVVFLSFTISSNNVIRAVGFARMAMMVMVTPAILNIFLDWLLVFKLDMGVRGAALGTVIAQVTMALWLAWYVAFVPGPLHLHWRDLRFDFPLIREIFGIGLSGFVYGASRSLVFGFLNNVVGNYGGTLAVSAFGVIDKLLRFAFMPVLGIAKGLQPIAGFNYGALRYDKARRVISLALANSTGLAFLGFVALFAVPQLWFRLFTKDPELIRIGSHALRIMVIGMPFVGIHMTTPTVFRALGKVAPSLVLSMTRWFLVLLPLVWLMPKFYGLEGVWLAYPAADALAACVAGLFLTHQMRVLHEHETGVRAPHIELEPAPAGE